MLEMAAHTVASVGILHSELRMVTVVIGEDFGNLLVTVEALKCRRFSAELVATRTLRRASKGLVGFGKWTRGDLGKRGNRACGSQCEEKQPAAHQSSERKVHSQGTETRPRNHHSSTPAELPRHFSVEMTLTQEVLRPLADNRMCPVLQGSCTNGQSYCDSGQLPLAWIQARRSMAAARKSVAERICPPVRRNHRIWRLRSRE